MKSLRSWLLAETLALLVAAQAVVPAGARAAAHRRVQPAKLVAEAVTAGPARARADVGGWTRLRGHVLPALATATALDPAAVPGASAAKDRTAEPISLTVVLARDDEAAFQRYLHDLYDPASPSYREFLSQREIADRFGPSPESYSRVRRYLERNRFVVVEEAANRLTLTVRGTRADAARAFDVRIADYQRGDRTFFATADDPALPADLAPHVQAIAGLSNLATPSHVDKEKFLEICEAILAALGLLALGLEFLALPVALAAVLCFLVHQFAQPPPPPNPKPPKNPPYNGPRKRRKKKGSAAEVAGGVRAAVAAADHTTEVDGTGQTIGLLEFDSFHTSDVANFLTLFGLPASLIDNVSQVHVNGGVAPGADEVEVLIDIDAILVAAPGAHVAVYDAPFRGAGNSFQPVLNRMITDGVTIISNSWAYCEDQTSLADVQSIDSILQNASMAGITVVTGAGDTGSTCLDGAANTIAVPAGSPHVTAVGGTTLTLGDAVLYGSETWWDGSTATPPTGQGGFGVSRFFPRPSYQDGLNSATNRSIPDVAVNADPASGITICQADDGGCPTGKLYGGTSLAAPSWAAFVALLNDSEGANLGELNPQLYPLAATDGFHSAASMGSDFGHVGLGSPNLDPLDLLLGGNALGPADADASDVYEAAQLTGGRQLPPIFPTPADGTTASLVAVVLRDANGGTVAGKTVTLAATGGSAIITPPSGVTNTANGAVVFHVTNLTAETVTLHATDMTDGIPLTQTTDVAFGVPPASQAGIGAAPPAVAANGMESATITITLKDALNRPTPGKVVSVSQGSGHSTLIGPSPAVTDANGQVVFTATNLIAETVTYSAVDMTDGELAFPGNAQVDFGGGTACAANAPPPVGQNGYAVAPFATEFPTATLSYGGVNFGGCSGISAPAFQDANMYLLDFLNGDVYQLPASGGPASGGTKLTTIGPTLAWPVFTPGGHLYATRAATTGDFTTGAILELDPTTGAVLRTVAPNLRCPSSLVVDPVSGDLFVDGECFGNGSDDASIHRVRNPDSVSPTVEVYATLPGTPNGQIVFAPSGNLYVAVEYTSGGGVVRVTGTNGPATPTVTTVASVPTIFWVNIGSVDQTGEPTSFITLAQSGDLQMVDLSTAPATTFTIANRTGGGTFGPDGCLYMPNGNVLYRLTDPAGGCHYGDASLGLSPASVTPDPQQGSPQTFTATLHRGTTPAGTPITFQVSGANTLRQVVLSDANGQAMFTYTGGHIGLDTIVASATIGAASLVSNHAVVAWDAGAHRTFLSLNGSVVAGTAGTAATVTAALVDTSETPAVAVAGQSVHFDIGGAQCSGNTDANGVATCQLTPTASGLGTLTATFAGTAQLAPSSASVGFNVVGAPCVPLDCDDGDACTTDTCNDAQCNHTTDPGYAGVNCYLTAIATALQSAAATDIKTGIRKSLQRRQHAIVNLVTKAQAGGKKGAKAHRRASKRLASFVKKLGKLHPPKITTPLDQLLTTLATTAKTLLAALPAT
jgi:hypothetical protein